ncbi:MAG TPA: sigma 54-interacting transcriptional regulator [Kofleriaceae bacterium]|jgi:transcriptional regulator with GAF, ATPase, and Fis domain|nr:sigma 54-interacting transcriptional regulator [Kofleriaceae bacterium]
MEADSPATKTVRGSQVYVRRFQVDVLDGPDRGARMVSTSDELTIGTAEGVDLRLTDPSVSRHHCTLKVTERGLELRDLGSTNGTYAGDLEVVRGFVRSGARIRAGTSQLGITVLRDQIVHALAPGDRFGELLGVSPVMRRLYPVLDSCAQSEITVLLHGETGTGKELIAEAIHLASPRRDAPFVVVDCSVLPAQLIESELFGHVRGAFTGADADRTGAFEIASGGTIFLDEIGELALDLQPVLLRALENRTIRRLGTHQQRKIDVRVIAASRRDLRFEVNQRRFRPDLYYRLNVMRIVVPALDEREGDVALLARHFWRGLRPDRELPEEILAELVRQRWPGNIRELRNAVERIALIGWTAPAPPARRAAYGQAKELASQLWERTWVKELLVENGYNVSQAARAAQMARSHLRQLVDRYGLGRPHDDDET